MRWLKLLGVGIETAIRLVIFVFPVSWVGQWADVTPSWKLMVFVVFFLLWSDIVLGSKDKSARPEDPAPAETPKRTVAPLTPAEVANEARKVTREPRHDSSNWI